jgi:peptidyl-tRNA hydrolase
MPPGKMAAQAGHAFLGAFLSSDGENKTRYASDPPGTKVVLVARDLPRLLTIRDLAQYYGVPYALIEDSGHVLLPFFDGSPVVTALGVGPATRKEVGFLKRLQMI